MAPQPATSSKATPTACWINPDTDDDIPAFTRRWMAMTWSSGSVTVIFLLAIPHTIPPASGCTSLSREGHQASGAVNGDQLAGLDLVRRIRYANDSRNAVLPCDHRAVRV